MWRALTGAVLAFSVFTANLPWVVSANAGRSSREIAQPLLVSGASTADKSNEQRISKTFGTLPLSFEANLGQVDPEVKFFSRSAGHGFYLTNSETVMVLGKRNAARPDVLKMKLRGANSQPHITGLDELPGKSNYFIGDDPGKWKTDVPSYSKVRYEAVYEGIDVVYHSTEQQIEYDFVIAPGADYKQIRLSFKGSRQLKLDKNGDLIVRMKSGDIRHLKPVIYQEIAGKKIEITGRYLLSGKQEIGFEVENYDRSRPLVIDPVISFSTYLGGDDEDWGISIAVDPSGNSYITGYTFSSNFPVNRNQTNLYDVFVVKLNPTGTAFVYKTYFGGSQYDYGYDIALDTAGCAYVVGRTESTNFPRVNALQNSRQGLVDGFITKLNAAGNGMVYSTYFGGNSAESVIAIAVDSAGSAYFAGSGSMSVMRSSRSSFSTRQSLPVTMSKLRVCVASSLTR